MADVSWVSWSSQLVHLMTDAQVKAYTKPPPAVETCLAAVMILFGKKTDWGEAKKKIGESDFLYQVSLSLRLSVWLPWSHPVCQSSRRKSVYTMKDLCATRASTPLLSHACILSLAFHPLPSLMSPFVMSSLSTCRVTSAFIAALCLTLTHGMMTPGQELR